MDHLRDLPLYVENTHWTLVLCRILSSGRAWSIAFKPISQTFQILNELLLVLFLKLKLK